MKRALLVALLACSLAACAGSSENSGNKSGEKTPITKVPPHEEEDPEVASDGKKWGGWRWKGKSDDCFYVAKNRCFQDEKKACKVAGCPDDCQIDGAGPAHVTCPGDDDSDE